MVVLLKGFIIQRKGLLHRDVSRAHGISPFRFTQKGMYCLSCDSGIFFPLLHFRCLDCSASADLGNKDSFFVKRFAIKLEVKGKKS